MKSAFGKLNLADWGKASIMTVGGFAVGAIEQTIQAKGTPTLHDIGAAASLGATAGLVYVLKNFFTNSQDKFLKAEPTN